MNFPHYYSRSRKYFLYYCSLFPFLSNHLGVDKGLVKNKQLLTPQVHPGKYSVHEVWQRDRYVGVAQTQLARRCL